MAWQRDLPGFMHTLVFKVGTVGALGLELIFLWTALGSADILFFQEWEKVLEF